MTTNTPGLEWAPAACTLPTAERPLRLAEFDDLFASALRGVERVTSTRTRLTLTGTEAVRATAEDLTARETVCCSFFAFTFTPTTPDSLGLDIEVPATQIDVLTALTARALAALQAGPA